MFRIKVCIKCDWKFHDFLNKQTTFYKYVSNISIWNNVQHINLSTGLLLSLLAAFFVDKTTFFSIFFLKFIIWSFINKNKNWTRVNGGVYSIYDMRVYIIYGNLGLYNNNIGTTKIEIMEIDIGNAIYRFWYNIHVANY